MHARTYRGYSLAWGKPGSLEVYIGTLDGDYITTAEDEAEAESWIDGWIEDER